MHGLDERAYTSAVETMQLSTIADTPDPLSLPVPVCDIDELPEVLRKGMVAKFDARAKFPRDVYEWDLAEWTRRFGTALASVHAFHEKAELAAQRYVTQCADEGVLVSLRKLNEVLHEAASFEKQVKKRAGKRGHSYRATFLGRRRSSIATIVEEMRRFASERLDITFKKETVTPEEAKSYLRKFSGAYGVINTREIPGWNYTYPSVYQKWPLVFNFLWLGLSVGGLHWDAFDNTLIQLRGRKRLLVFSPDLTSAIDGGQYITKFDSKNTLAPSNLASHKFLRHLPYYMVELEPGEGVVLPARAYHAAGALTHDSMSLNSFLLPHPSRGPLPYDKLAPYGWVDSTAFALSRALHSLAGIKLISVGPYNFV
jgi:hypothetical protein